MNEIIDFFKKFIFKQIKKVIVIKIINKVIGWNLLIFDGIIIIKIVNKFKIVGKIKIKRFNLFIQKIV